MLQYIRVALSNQATYGVAAKRNGSKVISGLLETTPTLSREARDPFRFQPDAPVRNFDVRKDIGGGELGLLTLRCFVSVRRECSDVDEPSNAGIGPSGLMRVPPYEM